MTLDSPLPQYAFTRFRVVLVPPSIAMPPDRPSGRRLPIGLMVVGSEMAGFTVVGAILDLALDTMPWLTIGLTILGFVIAFSHLVRMSKAMMKPPATPPNGSPR